jgi:hypothetical protein
VTVGCRSQHRRGTATSVIMPYQEGGAGCVLAEQRGTALKSAKHWTGQGTTDESVLPGKTDLNESGPQAFQRIVGTNPTWNGLISQAAKRVAA